MNRTRSIKVTVYNDRGGKLRWKLVGGNGEQIAKSPKGYSKMSEIIDVLAEIFAKEHDADLYQDKRGYWRWRFRLESGVAAIGSEGYRNKNDCKVASDLLLDADLPES